MTEMVNAMSAEEAREKTDAIKSKVEETAGLLLEMYERDGWKALGYKSWREYGEAEFSFSNSRIYQLKDHAQTLRRLENSTTVEKPNSTRQTRELAMVEPERQAEVWKEAVETAPKDRAGKPKVTAAHVKAVVASVSPPAEKSAKTPSQVEAPPPPTKTPGDVIAEIVAAYQSLKTNERASARKKIHRVDLKDMGDGVVIPKELQCEEFVSAWNEWLLYRRDRRLTVNAKTLQRQLDNTLLPLGADKAASCIDQSITQGWQGLFPEKSAAKAGKGSRKGFYERFFK